MKHGFTLIELLIVVAIIGILAAIAVPNFLNAQMRARVARVVSDMKAYAMAEEQYRLDNNQFTFDGDCGVGRAEHLSYIPLTTPVAYISSIPVDAFASIDPKFQNRQTVREGLKPTYEYTSRVSFGPNGTPNCKGNTQRYNLLGSVNIGYLFTSLGPDGDQDFPWSNEGYEKLSKGVGDFIYDPSNGVQSNGNIYVVNSRIAGGTFN
ncbi:prepilin-type N-terminal cleavage/methylation domain-containing protein [bacterium]|nr:prepilin-type N-terminal cleavage/methylation domain-containing protein [bacterium]